MSRNPVYEGFCQRALEQLLREMGQMRLERRVLLFCRKLLACPTWAWTETHCSILNFFFKQQKYYLLFTLSSCLELAEQVLFYYFNLHFPFLNHFKQRLFFLRKKVLNGLKWCCQNRLKWARSDIPVFQTCFPQITGQCDHRLFHVTEEGT